jgi:hypothetical protein
MNCSDADKVRYCGMLIDKESDLCLTPAERQQNQRVAEEHDKFVRILKERE